MDLKRWTTGVDLTADRAGFLLAADLSKSLAVIRATRDDASPYFDVVQPVWHPVPPLATPCPEPPVRASRDSRPWRALGRHYC